MDPPLAEPSLADPSLADPSLADSLLDPSLADPSLSDSLLDPSLSDSLLDPSLLDPSLADPSLSDSLLDPSLLDPSLSDSLSLKLRATRRSALPAATTWLPATTRHGSWGTASPSASCSTYAAMSSASAARHVVSPARGTWMRGDWLISMSHTFRAASSMRSKRTTCMTPNGTALECTALSVELTIASTCGQTSSKPTVESSASFAVG